jgi:16S rRNA processing protein RimM
MQVVVGRIGRPHGLAGDVSVEVRTDDPDLRLAPGTTLLADPASAGPLQITDSRVHSGRLLLHFAGIDDRSAAETLRNVLLVADVDPLQRPEDPDEFYDHQLVGLRVQTPAGEQVGTIADVLHLPGQDVLSVHRPYAPGEASESGEFLVPFVVAFVPTVDLDAGYVVITPPPGLLDPAEAERAEPGPTDDALG